MSQAQVEELKNFIEFKIKNAWSDNSSESNEIMCICKKTIRKTNLSRHLLLKHHFCTYCQEFHLETQFRNCPVYNEIIKIIYE